MSVYKVGHAYWPLPKIDRAGQRFIVRIELNNLCVIGIVVDDHKCSAEGPERGVRRLDSDRANGLRL